MFFAYEPGYGEPHFPEGLWPVYVAIGMSVLAIAVLCVLPERVRKRVKRRIGRISALLLLVAVGLFVYADARYEDCLDAGHHPWDTDHINPGKGICDRAVVGDVLTPVED